MVNNYKKRGLRKGYAESEAMMKAYEACTEQKMSIRAAAKDFNVNKDALGRRVRGEIPLCAKVGRKPTLCEKEKK